MVMMLEFGTVQNEIKEADQITVDAETVEEEAILVQHGRTANMRNIIEVNGNMINGGKEENKMKVDMEDVNTAMKPLKQRLNHLVVDL